MSADLEAPSKGDQGRDASCGRAPSATVRRKRGEHIGKRGDHRRPIIAVRVQALRDSGLTIEEAIAAVASAITRSEGSVRGHYEHYRKAQRRVLMDQHGEFLLWLATRLRWGPTKQLK